MEERKIEKGLRSREALLGARPGSSVPARELLASVSFLNFFRWVAPGGFCHLRYGWDAVNESGAMDQWRSGAKGAPAQAAATEQLRNDMLWRRKILSPRAMKKSQFRETGGLARRPRLPNLRDLALSMGGSSVATVYTDASSIQGWGATLGDRFVQGKWYQLERVAGRSKKRVRRGGNFRPANWSWRDWATAQPYRMRTTARVASRASQCSREK